MFLTFGDPAAKVAANVRSQGFGLDELQRDRLLAALDTGTASGAMPAGRTNAG